MENQKFDAKISFTLMVCHCLEWSNKAVFTMIAEKVSGIYKIELSFF